MDEEVFGLNMIFISIVGCIFFLLYYAIPSANMNQPVHGIEGTHQTAVEMNDKALHDDTGPAGEHESGEIISQAEGEDEPQAEQHTEVSEIPASESSDAGIIVMNNPIYAKHRRGLVQFTHEKHYTEYDISCGACHHDESGTPLEDLQIGDSVQSCAECHTETKKPKGEKLDKSEAIAKYHFEALHANCIGCHKPHNIEKGDPKGRGPAPTACGACHPKK